MLLLGGLLVAGCGAGSAAPPAVTATSEPLPTATPEPAPVGLAAVRASLDTDCDLTQLGARLSVTFAAEGTGGISLSRVRVRLNGRTLEDSGLILQRLFEDTRTVIVAAGTSHTVQLIAEAAGRPPTVSVNRIRCPDAPPGFQA